jgi:WD40 repeat protein
MGIFPIGASRLLFGRDFFISYPRREAARYAATLASRLSKQFSCYLDQLATPRGEKLPTPISRELARATVFVLVGSPGAIESIYVREEIRRFLETGRPLLLLDIDAALDRAPWDSPPWSSLVGVYRQRESLDAFQRAEPSQALLNYLHDSFTFTKQDRRLRVASTIATVMLATVPITATLSIHESRRAADAAKQASEARAEEAAARARAEEQRRIAVSRRLAGEAIAQMRERPDLGLLLAVTAHDIHPSAEARRSLFAGLTFHPGLSRIIRDAQSGKLQGLTVSADGRFFATGSHEAITVWDASTFEPRARIQEEGENFRCFALSNDGTLLAACRSQHLTLIDAMTGRALGRIDAAIDTVSFVGPRLLAVGEGSLVEVWDVSAPGHPVSKSRLTLNESVEAVIGDPAGRFLVAATFKRVVVCTPVPCQIKHTLTDAGDIGLTRLAVHSTAEMALVAAANAGGRLVVWNLATGERVASLSLVGGLGDRDLFQLGSSPGGDMFSVAFSRDGERLAVGSLRGRFATGTVEELGTWTALQQASAEERDAELALFGMSGALALRQAIYAPGIQALAFAGEPPRLIVEQMDEGLSVWEIGRPSPLEHLTPWPSDEAAHGLHTFSADGRYVLHSSSVREQRFDVWSIGGAGAAASLEPVPERRRFYASAISTDGQAVAAFDEVRTDVPWRTLALWDRGGTLRSHTIIDERVVHGLRAGIEASCTVLGGPPPGRLLATAFASGEIAAWDVSDLSAPRLLGVQPIGGRVEALAISSVKPQLAIASREGSVAVWDLAGGTVGELSREVPGVFAMAFTEDGRTLTAFAHAGEPGAETSRLLAWDLPSRRLRTEWIMDGSDSFTLSLNGHALRKEALTVDPDGTTFAIGDNDTVALWDVESRALLGGFRLPQRIDALRFTEDGDYLLAATFAGVSRLEIGARRLTSRACEVAGRSLTPAESKRFLGFDSPPPSCSPERAVLRAPSP